MLDDRVTAQYTHTLTVTGRLGGLYTCTVANDKPSSDSAQLNVQGIIYTICHAYNIQSDHSVRKICEKIYNRCLRDCPIAKFT